MSERWSRRRFLALAGATGLAGCVSAGSPGSDRTTAEQPNYDLSAPHDLASWDRYDPDWSSPTASPVEAAVETEVLVENLEIPWDLSFAPSGELFITERIGRIKVFDGDDVREVTRPADAIDAGSLDPGSDESSWWVEGGEGGTLGVAVHPAYPDPPVVYVYYTYEDGDERYNRVAYVDVSADDPEATETTIVDGIPADSYHNGGRLTFGPENYLWITTGDAGEEPLAADPESVAGAVLRVTPDGNPAPGNPGVGDPRVYTYGHRNPQGVTFLPDGTPVVDEHGPGGNDEVNVLVPGHDYGWPDAREVDEYPADGVHPPVANTGNATWAPSGSVFYTGDALPQWRNRLVIGALGGQHVNVVTLSQPDRDLPPADGGRRFDDEFYDDRYTATSHTTFEDELGRVRHVEQGPDDALYGVTCNRDGRAGDGFPTERDDVLVRFTPGEE
ncbi:PQQ-dependent sugar dehydrogenase [Halostella sp. JP-L12]|uniref:PQQ-dependent sugar dehydrogenase n=1 Tax=Halostella TaxID=1843185 RepID=UPI000EF7E9FA|nr:MULTISPECIES: PQQ-dependent sugar dehydrogenase [Halostella]NHN48241.1 PQQ-dependent sugar dehydrogenase [Halostella sp. JP-L12]